MLFAITVACSDQHLDFDNGPNTKRNSNEQDDVIIDDTGIPIDNTEPSQEEEEIEDDGIVDVNDIMDIFQTYSCQGCHGSSGGFRLNTNELKWINAYHQNLCKKLSPSLLGREKSWLQKVCKRL